MSEPQDLSKILQQVQKLIAMAEHPIAPGATDAEREATENQQRAARLKAESLMLNYAISEAMVEMAKPVISRGQPISATYAMASGDLSGYVAAIASTIARHCRCKNRNYTSYEDHDGQHMAMGTVYGFEADVRWFEVLYTTTRLHMLGLLKPGVNPHLSLEENCYRLHTAGYNWREIAKLYGWKPVSETYGSERQAVRDAAEAAGIHLWDVEVPYVSRDLEIRGATSLGWVFKRAYQRFVKAQGKAYQAIAANGTRGFRQDAAQGYLDVIARRLREMKLASDEGTSKPGAIALRDRAEDLDDWFREQNARQYTRCPSCQKLSDDKYQCDRCGEKIADPPPDAAPCPKCKAAKGGRCREHWAYSYSGSVRKTNRAAYALGRDHGMTADLGGAKMGRTSRQLP